jgi:hypothetical protein
MPQPAPLPSLEYLFSCSNQSLAELELSCLNRSQQCAKAAKQEWDEALAQREAAGVARWLMENRKELLKMACLTLEGKQGTIPFPAQRRSA